MGDSNQLQQNQTRQRSKSVYMPPQQLQQHQRRMSFQGPIQQENQQQEQLQQQTQQLQIDDFEIIENVPVQEQAPPATVHRRSRSDKKLDTQINELQTKLANVSNDIDSRLARHAHVQPIMQSNLEDRKKQIEIQRKLSIAEAKRAHAYTDVREREIEAEAARQLAEAYDEYIPSISVEKEKELKQAYRAKEEAQIRQHQLLKRNKIEQIENPVERKRELDTYKRHQRFDFVKKFLYKPTELAIEGARYRTGNKDLVNVGRAFFGGTKPMYIFEDRNQPILGEDGQQIIENGKPKYKQYLYKEAVNCVGKKKVQGALVTEAASKLQQIVCRGYAIEAFTAKNANNEVLGSFQEKIDQCDKSVRVDLFKWQAAPTDTLDAQMKGEILREHTLDWLLCNFDTKGENFLHRTDMHLSSFDKEASFSFIKDRGAQHMSTEYIPHSNDTLYNIFFREYAQGRIKELDFRPMLENAQRIQNMPDNAYIGLFDEMLHQKYPKQADYLDMKDRILARKNSLVREYGDFIQKLQQQRYAAENGEQLRASDSEVEQRSQNQNQAA